MPRRFAGNQRDLRSLDFEEFGQELEEGLVGLTLFGGLRHGDLESPGVNAGDAILSSPGLRLHGKNDALTRNLKFNHARPARRWARAR